MLVLYTYETDDPCLVVTKNKCFHIGPIGIIFGVYITQITISVLLLKCSVLSLIAFIITMSSLLTLIIRPLDRQFMFELDTLNDYEIRSIFSHLPFNHAVIVTNSMLENINYNTPMIMDFLNSNYVSEFSKQKLLLVLEKYNPDIFEAVQVRRLLS